MENGKYLKPKRAAEYLNKSEPTLAKWRVSGCGPKFIKISHRSVLYDVSDLDEWMASKKVSSTSEACQ